MTAHAQTERITILTTPDFKSWLTKAAKTEGISMSEFVRQRCEQKPSQDEILLSALMSEVKTATQQAKNSLEIGLNDARTVLSALRSLKQ